MLKQINAVNEHKELFSVILDIPSKDFDVLDGIKKSCDGFCKTRVGQEISERKGRFTLWDFALIVPNEFCRLHGFKKLSLDSIVISDDDICIQKEAQDN